MVGIAQRNAGDSTRSTAEDEWAHVKPISERRPSSPHTGVRPAQHRVKPRAHFQNSTEQFEIHSSGGESVPSDLQIVSPRGSKRMALGAPRPPRALRAMASSCTHRPRHALLDPLH